MANLLAVHFNYRAWRLEITAEHFALFKDDADKPTLVGPRSALKFDKADLDDACLSRLRLEDGSKTVDIDRLKAVDIRTFRSAWSGVSTKADSHLVSQMPQRRARVAPEDSPSETPRDVHDEAHSPKLREES